MIQTTIGYFQLSAACVNQSFRHFRDVVFTLELRMRGAEQERTNPVRQLENIVKKR